jgi:hypothetical protein
MLVLTVLVCQPFMFDAHRPVSFVGVILGDVA